MRSLSRLAQTPGSRAAPRSRRRARPWPWRRSTFARSTSRFRCAMGWPCVDHIAARDQDLLQDALLAGADFDHGLWLDQAVETAQFLSRRVRQARPGCDGNGSHQRSLAPKSGRQGSQILRSRTIASAHRKDRWRGQYRYSILPAEREHLAGLLVDLQQSDVESPRGGARRRAEQGRTIRRPMTPALDMPLGNQTCQPAPPLFMTKSSSSDTRYWKLPGSPWRPQRPKSWRSMRPASCRSVAITCSPPRLGDAGAELDVGAAPGHVGGHRDAAGLAGLARRSRPRPGPAAR